MSQPLINENKLSN